MGTKDEIKGIADMHNKESIDFANRVNECLSEIYKQMYQLAYKGEYKLHFSVSKKESKVYHKVIKILLSEGFSVSQTKAITEESDGWYDVTWNN